MLAQKETINLHIKHFEMIKNAALMSYSQSDMVKQLPFIYC